MSTCRVVLVLLMAFCRAPSAVHATVAQDSSVTVRLITVGAGEEVWERFGHNAIWIHDAESGTDLAYDYGRFNFAEPGFLRNFVQGRMRYWMGSSNPGAMIEFYKKRNRSVWVQELAIPPAAARELRAMLRFNLEPENRYYAYDYYRDNCSTRIRDALDRVLRGAIRAQSADTVPRATYRWHTDRLLAPDLLSYSGTKAGLGPQTDRPVSKWQEMFVPMMLQQYLREVRLVDSAGVETPLVITEEALYETDREAEPQRPPGRYGLFLLMGMIPAVILVVAAWAARRSRLAVVSFVVLSFSWALLGGVGGVLLLFLWFGTDHVMTVANENVLQFNVLALVLLILLPSVTSGRVWPVKPARIVAILIAGASLLGLAAKLLPRFSQDNWQILLVTVPLNLGLALAVWLVSVRRSSVLRRL